MDSSDENMSETEAKLQDKQPQICNFAVASAMLAAGCFLLFAIMRVLGPSEYPPSSKTAELVREVLFFVFVGCAAGGFILGIVALVKMKRSKSLLNGKGLAIFGTVVGGLIILLVSLGYLVMVQKYGRGATVWIFLCKSNLAGLGKGMQMYADNNEGKYPTADKWCDLLLESNLAVEKQFICRNAGEGRCHYAMNPDCEVNSPGDMVLLFESKPGWNQCGGPELLAPENHGGKGCNILFNDGNVDFVKADTLKELKWK